MRKLMDLNHVQIAQIPSWAGFNAILYPEMPVVSNIGYCPVINGSPKLFDHIHSAET